MLSVTKRESKFCSYTVPIKKEIQKFQKTTIYPVCDCYPYFRLDHKFIYKHPEKNTEIIRIFIRNQSCKDQSPFFFNWVASLRDYGNKIDCA